MTFDFFMWSSNGLHAVSFKDTQIQVYAFNVHTLFLYKLCTRGKHLNAASTLYYLLEAMCE